MSEIIAALFILLGTFFMVMSPWYRQHQGPLADRAANEVKVIAFGLLLGGILIITGALSLSLDF